MPSTPADPAAAFQVLIVEDEYFIADDLVRSLKAEGIGIAGPVANERAARAELNAKSVDFAVLDINLGGRMSFEVAADLRERQIPFVFLTGYDQEVVPPAFADETLYQKPRDTDRVIAEIKRRRSELGRPEHA